MKTDQPLVTLTVLTGAPTLFGSLDTEGMIRIALDRGLARLRIVNLRDYTDDRHRTIDDSPYGGGPGMILKAEPVIRALEALPESEHNRRVVLMSPKGRVLSQDFLARQAEGSDLVLICGRYKAVDERVRDFIDDEISLGDFVISGGELAAMVIIDGIVRLIPGVLGDLDSALGDSFTCGLLDCAYYTRPEVLREKAVPPVLLSGNHAKIKLWRRQDALKRTLERRADLLQQTSLDRDDKRFLDSHGWSDPGDVKPRGSGKKTER